MYNMIYIKSAVIDTIIFITYIVYYITTPISDYIYIYIYISEMGVEYYTWAYEPSLCGVGLSMVTFQDPSICVVRLSRSRIHDPSL